MKIFQSCNDNDECYKQNAKSRHYKGYLVMIKNPIGDMFHSIFSF